VHHDDPSRQKTTTASADERGMITLRDIEVPSTCRLKWGYEPKGGESPRLLFSLDLHLNIEEASEEEEAKKTLNNLGYVKSALAANFEAFQRDYGHRAGPGESRMDLLRRIYRSSADDLEKAKRRPAEA
jgi:hypothetical protein